LCIHLGLVTSPGLYRESNTKYVTSIKKTKKFWRCNNAQVYEVIQYVHNNPVKDGGVNNGPDILWSRYDANMDKVKPTSKNRYYVNDCNIEEVTIAVINQCG
jgi:hypothetical protein